jgi:Zn-finger nucleic acid-binding protein
MISVCPRCDKALFILEYEGIAVDFCHHCRGLWLDAGELELLLKHSGAAPQDRLLTFQQEQGSPSKGERMLCPRCDRRMVEVPVQGEDGKQVMIDRCPQGHGLWFDQSELQQLLSFIPTSPGVKKAIEHLNDLLGGPGERT